MEQRLIRLEDPQTVRPLFEGWPETLIRSALEGAMGSFWAVERKPRAALCVNGDFLFLAGEPREPQTRAILECLAREKRGYAIVVPRDPACGALIERAFESRARREWRYAFCKGGEAFDRAKLRALTRAVPGVQVVPFDRALYETALQNDWSRDFVSQFRSAQDFLNRGLGYAALQNGEMVGGASSYVRCSFGVEVQVETRSDWRRRGVAAACCAALILQCLERGLYPSWDAANRASEALACKLGYRKAGPYPVWEIDC